MKHTLKYAPIISLLPLYMLTFASQLYAEDKTLKDLLEYEQISAEEVAERGSFTKRPLTVLVYMAADNDLHPFVAGDFKKMEQIGSTANMNILIYLNTKYPRQAKVTRKFVVGKGKSLQYGPDEVRDSGDPETLIDALAWAHQTFPSDQFMLILWDHGSGSLNRLHPGRDDRAVCYDFTTGNYFTDAKLQYALDTCVRQHRNGKKIDIVAFDACLMACIEIGAILQPYADYMVASQETVPGTGYGYHHVLQRPALEVMSARDISIGAVLAHEREYKGKVDDYTMSAIDLGLLMPLINDFEELTKALLWKLSGVYGPAIREALHATLMNRYNSSFHSGNYVDVDEWCASMGSILNASGQGPEIAPLLRMIDQVRTKLRVCTIANVRGTAHPSVEGTSIYFPKKGIDSTYPGLIWSQHTSWNQLLHAFKGK